MGKDDKGEQCICMRCTTTHVVDNRTLCSNCGHIESAHPYHSPQPPVAVGSLIKQFQAAGKLGAAHPASSSSSKFKASQSEAEAETNNGLRRKRKSETDTEPPTKKSGGKTNKDEKVVFLSILHIPLELKFGLCQPAKKVKGEDVELGHVVVLIRGTKVSFPTLYLLTKLIIMICRDTRLTCGLPMTKLRLKQISVACARTNSP